MNEAQIYSGALLVFFCLWTASLARLKGYSAACWFLAGGAVGVVVLCFLPAVSFGQPQKRIRGNRLGLLMSAVSLSGVWFAVHGV